jgi:site-specific DNA-methyltransferase (adenine-specific)
MTQATFGLRGRNPDVLTCIANLSNDEVFTPPDLANQMLDAVEEAWAANHSGESIWQDSGLTFLDPFTKSGVFLREITKRLVAGLENEIPDLAERVDHILTNQVFGIAITELTALLARRSLYCSKYADGPHSVVDSFTTNQGNVWFQRTEHTWVKGKCRFCNASQAGYQRGSDLETHAYEFIHADKIGHQVKELFGNTMRFDVIIGNPPYQLGSDGGTRDVPIYQHFVQQAKRLDPQLLSMVIPSRWMATGLGLKEFREEMLADRSLRVLVDYENSRQVFPGVDFEGGACYFLRDQSFDGDCAVTTIDDNKVFGPTSRRLDEFEIFVRDARSLEILHKVLAHGEESITEILSVDKEFGWTSNFSEFHGTERRGDVPLHYIRQGKRLVGFIERERVTKSPHLIDTWKVMVPKAYGERSARPAKILGPTLLTSSPSVCTQSFLFFFVKSERAAKSLNSYLQTRFFRFLVSLRKITQDAARSTYTWVPQQAWNRNWSDRELYDKYNLTSQEVSHIETMIRPIEPTGE